MAEKTAEWTKIHGEPKGKGADFYAPFTTLTLTQSSIDSMLLADLNSFEKQLRFQFANYGNFPQTAQAGLIDMAFTLGVAGLISGFAQFVAAVHKQDWATAASQSRRTTVSAQRNAAIQQLFLKAAATQPLSKPPTQKPAPPTPTPPPIHHPGTGSTGHIGLHDVFLSTYQPVSGRQGSSSASALPSRDDLPLAHPPAMVTAPSGEAETPAPTPATPAPTSDSNSVAVVAMVAMVACVATVAVVGTVATVAISKK